VPIQLAPRQTDPTKPKINTIATDRRYRMNRLKGDLDRSFNEISIQETATSVGLPYINLYGFPIDTANIGLIPKVMVERYRVGVFALHGNDVYVATDKPGIDGQLEYLRSVAAKGGFKIKVHICSTSSLEKIINTFNYVIQIKEERETLDISDKEISEVGGILTNLDYLQPIVEKLDGVSDIMRAIFIAAMVNDASDIHFEPEKEAYYVRLRLDGVLYNFAKISNEMQPRIESRIKLVSGCKLNVSNVPQDGRMTFKYGTEKEVDVRVSLLPSSYGYSIVMRILGNSGVSLSLDDLGFLDYAKVKIDRAAAKPQGLILTTGPTGSGKTTTLYSLLNVLNTPSTKIITLEDPIEYKLHGISQTQVDSEGGLSFGVGLKSVLRQDPDVIMVGEIRDNETAETAVQASLTGHKVLSTVHTNDAAGAMTRMLELGVKGFALADSVELIIGQRLIRKICPHCKREEQLSPEVVEIINKHKEKMPEELKNMLPLETKFYTSDGCEKCNHLGYKGRVGVFEIMSITDIIREKMADNNVSVIEVRNAALSSGMSTMFQDGILKAMLGLTDIKELMRVVQY
jgi:type IV pilus assembly protein PilB